MTGGATAAIPTLLTSNAHRCSVIGLTGGLVCTAALRVGVTTGGTGGIATTAIGYAETVLGRRATAFGLGMGTGAIDSTATSPCAVLTATGVCVAAVLTDGSSGGSAAMPTTAIGYDVIVLGRRAIARALLGCAGGPVTATTATPATLRSSPRLSTRPWGLRPSMLTASTYDCRTNGCRRGDGCARGDVATVA